MLNDYITIIDIIFMKNNSYLTDNERMKEIKDRIDRFRPIDDTFLSLMIQNNKEVAEYILQVIMEMEDLKVLEVHSQDSVSNIFGRSARFDILAKDNKGKLYNIEIQRTNAGAIRKRARFNSSILDQKGIDTGENYDKLNETYIIFITENDVLKGALPIYHIERTILETKELFNDEEHIIYVNSSYTTLKTNLGRLMHDFYCNKADDMLCLPIKEATKKLKETKEGNKQMCEIAEELISKGKAEAIAEDKEAVILMLEKDFGLSHEEAVKKANETIKTVS